MSPVTFPNNKTVDSKVLLNDLSPLVSGKSDIQSIERLLDDKETRTAQVIRRLKSILNGYEQKYRISSAEFYQRIVGTPEDDTPDFINWAINYRCFCRLTNKGIPDGTV